jgi:hypothetical protein
MLRKLQATFPISITRLDDARHILSDRYEQELNLCLVANCIVDRVTNFQIQAGNSR